MLIDSHCHLDPEYLQGGPAPVLERAEAAGVGAFVCIGVGRDLRAARAAVSLADARANVFATVGVHPHDASGIDRAGFEELERLSRHPRVVAVGEVGLDYHYDHSPRDVQKTVFRRMIALAREVKKPLVIHTRSAPADTLCLLEEEGARDVGGIIHCFSEDRPFAERALSLDFDLSFSGILTFKTAHAIRDAAKWAPADRILVETDSPFLAPVPLRGKPCEPAYIVHTAKYLADLRGAPLESIAETTTANVVKRLSLASVPMARHDQREVRLG
ncbi:MAG TPA: TatD family hydrolase [Polyangiaceae bacterium]|nr:TatD family hydrolase [Polyangiaceae bacterium]